MESEKEEIRKKYRDLRAGMPAEQVRSLSARICENILAGEAYREAGFLYAYYPLGNEADIRPVILQAWRNGKRVAFPRVYGKDMMYYEAADFSRFSQGAFGVMEPCGTDPVDWKHALVLVPGVAFDRDHNRIGYGGGYYDRYFGDKTGCLLLGVAYGLQVASKLPADLHDRKMDALVTEERTDCGCHGKNTVEKENMKKE